MLTKTEILQAEDLKKEVVSIPEWGGDVIVRTLTAHERDNFEASLRDEGDKINLDNIRARLCAITICNESGERLFSNEDIIELGDKSAAALDRVFTVAQKLNAMTPEDIKELEKNSEATLADDSISD